MNIILKLREKMGFPWKLNFNESFFSYPLLSTFPLCDCSKNSVGQLRVKKLNKGLSQWCSCAAFLDRATNTLTQMFTQAEGTRVEYSLK